MPSSVSSQQASRGQIPRRARSRTAAGDDALGSRLLRLECVERRLHQLLRHAALLEVGADQRVAGAPLGERGRARLRDPRVVHVPRPGERLQCLLTLARTDATLHAGGRRARPPCGRAEALVTRCRLRFAAPRAVRPRSLAPTSSSSASTPSTTAGTALGSSRAETICDSGLRLDPPEDLLDDVGMLLQEGGRILASLAEPLVAEAEVRAGLLDDLPLERDVEHRPLP